MKKKKSKIKALALFSGGLDSMLSIKIIQNQDISVSAIHFVFPFDIKPNLALYKSADYLGVELIEKNIDNDYLEILKEPPNGYGKSVNPCIDCRAYYIKKAKEYMEKNGFDFLISGEVIGQRPKSQRPIAMKIIESESRAKSLLLRPLSARLLDMTIPEKMGWVNRELLYDISGRSRQRQIQLAKEFNIKDYPSSGGGCVLTERGYGRRIKFLLKYIPEFTLTDLRFARLGHNLFFKGIRIISGRNSNDNILLEKTFFNLSSKEQKRFLLLIPKFPGPSIILDPYRIRDTKLYEKKEYYCFETVDEKLLTSKKNIDEIILIGGLVMSLYTKKASSKSQFKAYFYQDDIFKEKLLTLPKKAKIDINKFLI